MVASRIRPKGTRSVSFGLSAFCIALLPTQVGFQDLAALIARQPSVSARWRQHVIASPFGTIHAATFSFPRPVGTAMPEPPNVRLAHFDPASVEVTGAIGPARAEPDIDYPIVNRALKGDRLPVLAPPEPSEPLPQLEPVEARPEPAADGISEAESVPGAEVPPEERKIAPPTQSPQRGGTHAQVAGPAAHAQTDVSTNPGSPQATTSERPDSAAVPEDAIDEAAIADLPPEVGDGAAADSAVARSRVAALSFIDASPTVRRAEIYFGPGAMGLARQGLEQWAPGAEPILVSPALVDPDIKLSALAPAIPQPDGVGETVVGKGEVQSTINRRQSPAERLGLTAKTRPKAEKCLADAVYFESRGEPLRGQLAVSQVVLNRVFSGFYPNSVCGVVYQNSHRRLACQFTFACDGIRDRVTEPEMWVQAKRIAKDALDGKVWLPEVGHATHYHAYWVRPSWVHEMKKMHKLGVHTFYRPRAWGSGADEPAWGNVPDVVPVSAKPEPAAVKPEAAIARDAPTAKL